MVKRYKSADNKKAFASECKGFQKLLSKEHAKELLATDTKKALLVMQGLKGYITRLIISKIITC
jgi:hypothetical protein